VLWGCRGASADLSGSQPIPPFLCISLDRRAIENNGIQGAISKSENWHCWEEKERGCSCALWVAMPDLGRVCSRVIYFDRILLLSNSDRTVDAYSKDGILQ
jgi:hypothetical protein